MGTKTTGYQSKRYNFPTKRYCRTLDLKDNQELIEEYVKRHSEKEIWPIVMDGIREVGILEMEIYLLDNHLFMIIEAPVDFDLDKAFEKLATLPKQTEWEEYMSIFQNTKQGATASEKWQLMDRIFKLYE